MLRKLNLTTVAFAVLTSLFACAAVSAQTQSRPGEKPAPTPGPAESVRPQHHKEQRERARGARDRSCEAACGVISPAAENTDEGVQIILSYSACGGETAQRPGGTIHGIIVHGGKNPGGNLSIAVGDSRVTSQEEAAAMSRAAGVAPAVLRKGSGSPKQAGF
jgi:hypothetical protein